MCVTYNQLGKLYTIISAPDISRPGKDFAGLVLYGWILFIVQTTGQMVKNKHVFISSNIFLNILTMFASNMTSDVTWPFPFLCCQRSKSKQARAGNFHLLWAKLKFEAVEEKKKKKRFLLWEEKPKRDFAKNVQCLIGIRREAPPESIAKDGPQWSKNYLN